MLLLLLACTAPAPVDTEPGDTDRPDTGTTDTTPPDTGPTDTDRCSGDVPLGEHGVWTTSGVLDGEAAGAGRSWKGVPYAEPPVGDRRFRFPTPRACVEGEILDARAFGGRCPQRDADGLAVGQEDCLTLNVWTPSLDPQGAPLLVFLHGGGNVVGSAGEEDQGITLYDGADLAARTGAVVVTVQYRLGALGFLAHPALTTEYGTGSGNLGLRDQLLAVDWIRDNAASFGADADRLVLFGESAGGQDTCLLSISPLAAGKVHGAVVQSASCATRSATRAEAEGTAAAEALGCGDGDVVACLRTAPVEDLVGLAGDPIGDLGVPGEGGFGPTVDGELLPEDPVDLVAAGRAPAMPRILGTNRDESAQWVSAMTDEDYTQLVDATFGSYADEMAAAYPVEDFDSARWAWIALTTDGTFTCPARRLARAFAAAGTGDTWRYWFTKAPDGATGTLYGAFHGLELIHVFQHLDEVAAATGYTPDAADVTAESVFGAAWGNLATSGTPGAPEGLPTSWPPVSVGSDHTLEIGESVRVVDDVNGARCDVWDPILDLLE